MASGTISAGAELIDLLAESGTFVTTPTATDTLLQELSIPAGYHLILITVTFKATNGNGSRKVMASINNDALKNILEVAPNPNGYTTVTTFTTYRLPVAVTLKIWCNQTSGVTMDAVSVTQDLIFN